MATFIKTLKDVFGNQVIPRTRTSAVTLSDGTGLDAYEDNIKGGGGIRPQIVVTAPAGAVVTCTDGTITMTGVSTGTYTFYVPHFGTYTVSSVLEYQTAPIQTVLVDTVTIYHVTLVHFVATISVTSPVGAALTCKSGNTTLTGTSTGVYTFSVRFPGTWIVTATLNGRTSQRVIEVSDAQNKDYSADLNFYYVYGVRINTTSSNPDTSVSYIEGTDAYGMSKGSPSWDTKPIFNSIKPCLLVNGNVSTYLNPANYSQSVSGSAVDISANSNGDVMIEFSKGGYKIIKNENFLDIYVTDNPDARDEGYVYYPFSYAAEGDCNHFYWGAYLGFDSVIKLRSVSGVTPSINLSMQKLRTSARGNGTGYELTNFFQLLWIQILYIVKYGNLNAQTTLGGGNTNSGSIAVTGATNTSGFNFGTPSNYGSRVKLFGIEDFYGNARYFMEGVYYTPDYRLCLTYPGYSSGYNDTGADYRFSISIGTVNLSTEQYARGVVGTNEAGFIMNVGDGSTNTYFSDRCATQVNRAVSFGGYHQSAEGAGVFSLVFEGYFSTSYTSIGARLSYCYTGK